MSGEINKKITNNNFDIIRLILSVIVVFSHIYDLNRSNNFFLSFFSGEFAVESFFAISGYLIIRSFKNNGNIKRYFYSRAFRILPMYYCSLLTFFIILFFISGLDLLSYFSDGGARYLIFNAVFLNFIHPDLPGVFIHNPRLAAVNGALWTIKVEVAFYVLVPFIVILLSKVRMKVITLLVIAFLSVLFKWLVVAKGAALHIPHQLENQLPAVLSFFIFGGVLNYINLNKIPSLVIGLVFIISLIFIVYMPDNNGFIYMLLRPIAIAFFILTLCLQRFIVIGIPHSIGDLSYGIYVTHFPLIQLYISLGFFANFWLGFSLVLLTVFVIAFFSWRFIEKPALNFARNKR